MDRLETRLAPVAELLRTGQVSLKAYLDQLEDRFHAENERVQAFLPELNRFERLRQEAARLEMSYPMPTSRPLLYGILVGVKDIFHAEGFPTKAGSRLSPEILAGSEAKTVSMLKKQGALVLGKTVTTEFAYFGPGPTRNPHNLGHTPGGSSSGSAAAVAAGLCPLALGTQTIGSIIRPASFCGVVGFKPSAGRISTEGVIPLSPTLDHIGLFTTDIAGTILAASIVCTDWAEISESGRAPTLGIPEGPYLQKAGTEGLAHFENTVEQLAERGYTVKHVEAMPDFEDIYAAHNDLMAAEAATVHHDWFDAYSDRYYPKTVELIEQGQKVSAQVTKQARLGREKLRNSLMSLMDEHQIDVWISPAAVGTAPAGIDSTGDPVMNLPWTYAGLPAINLPSGFGKNNLPLGLQLVGRWQQDEQLLAWAKEVAPVLK